MPDRAPCPITKWFDQLASVLNVRRLPCVSDTPYDLRHSSTSLLSEVGVPPEMLADLLGHVDTRMVHRFYRHPVSPAIRVAAEHIDTALGL